MASEGFSYRNRPSLIAEKSNGRHLRSRKSTQYGYPEMRSQSMNNQILRTSALCASLLSLVSFTLWAAPSPKPNVVVIMADDLGYGDVSFNGAKAIQTPNLDRLAAEGLNFSSGYCSASTCTPSRFSLLTGVYAFRVPHTGIAAPEASALIRPGMETIADLAKKAGYATAVIGKWHLGLGDKKPDWNGEIKPGPLEIGFDHCFIYPSTNDRVPSVFIQDHRVLNLDPSDPLWVGGKSPSPDHPTGKNSAGKLRMEPNGRGHAGTVVNGVPRMGFFTGGTKAVWRDEDLAATFVAQTNQWFELHLSTPFFLYLAPNNVHVPRLPNERFVGKSVLGARGDSILEFDWLVGEVLKSLDRLNLSEKTLVILCSDNGPVAENGYKDEASEKQRAANHHPAGPSSGGTNTVWEGGSRSPFVTRGKGHIEPGSSDQIVCTIDLPASFAALTGVKIPEGACRDSQNVLDALLGKPGAKGRESLVQQANGGANRGYRSGDWKLVREDGVDHLFQLSTDPGEKNDVAGKYPEDLKRLQGELTQTAGEELNRKPKRKPKKEASVPDEDE